MTRISLFKLFVLSILVFSCNQSKPDKLSLNQRTLIDTIGFSQYQWQFDSIISRINPKDKLKEIATYKAVICPHDDYAYAAGLYAKTLSGIKAKTIVLVGVAHKARNFNLENKLVFGSFDSWKCNENQIKVSSIRDEILEKLPNDIYVVHDSMMQMEHSLEAINPFLQKNNTHTEIIPILIPYTTFKNMDKYSDILADTLHAIIRAKKLNYGKDIAVVISNDAIHYGNTGWGGANLAPFGIDSIGNKLAKEKDLKIINQCLEGEINYSKIKIFNAFTVKENDFKAYQWTWCGRYSVPFGLLLANKLNVLENKIPLIGKMIDYRSSFPGKHIRVEDIGMGHTAPAVNSHWVAYVGVGYQ